MVASELLHVEIMAKFNKNVHAVKAAEHWSRLGNFSPCRGVLKLSWTGP